MEYYSAERKKELLPFTTAWMELESIMLSEINKFICKIYLSTKLQVGSSYSECNQLLGF